MGPFWDAGYLCRRGCGILIFYHATPAISKRPPQDVSKGRCIPYLSVIGAWSVLRGKVYHPSSRLLHPHYVCIRPDAGARGSHIV